MADTRIDVQFIVAEGFRALESSSAGVQDMMSSPIFAPSPPSIVTKARAEYLSINPNVADAPQIEDVIEGSQIAMNMIVKISKVIRDRSKHLSMKVDPTKQPDLYRAGQGLFGNSFNGTVTFKMYESLITYVSQITQQLGAKPAGVPGIGDIV